ncbi:LIP-domain-containing protein [Xylariaceae sp. FL0016]|nr:LIP-domain-containing protein [Xylariaceae sp. FL0016]
MRGLSWLWLCGFSAVSAQQHLSRQVSQPLPPSQDPWYSAPPGFESTNPGAILRLRSAPGNLTTVVGNTSAAYNILYRTTDSRYQPSWAVTTLFVPNSFYVSPSGNRALLSYQFAYDSADVDSGPSYGLYYSLAQAVPSLGVPSDTGLLNSLLSQGWVVNTPDYEGPTAAFGASVQAGQATLDAVRAMLNLGHLTGQGIGTNNVTVALWGYSGGSIATEAASELQVQYAPELVINGAAASGLVTDFSITFDLFNESPIAGDLVAVLLGVTAQYPPAAAYLRSRLQPENASVFLGAKNMITGAATSYFSMKNIYSYFLNGAADLKATVLQKVYHVEMKLGYHGVPAMPMYIYNAIHDEYCPAGQTDELVAKYCGAGASITYDRNTVGGHVAEIVNGQPRAMEWVWSIFKESYISPSMGCLTRNVTVNISGLSS